MKNLWWEISLPTHGFSAKPKSDKQLDARGQNIDHVHFRFGTALFTYQITCSTVTKLRTIGGKVDFDKYSGSLRSITFIN